MPSLATKLIGTAAVALILHGCGGGGGGGGSSGSRPPAPPGDPAFGLTTRPAAASLNFPGTSSIGTIMLTTVADGFDSPVFFAAIPGQGSRYVVVEKGGRIKVLDANFDVESILLDISARVVTTSEQGLLGLAFDPDFASNGYIYVNYNSLQTGGRCAAGVYPQCTLISRFTLNRNGGGNLFTPIALGTEHVLLEISQPFENHKGGMLAFGQDNNLYIATGDGGSAGDPNNYAQNLDVLLGKILRIDPNGGNPYSIPATNPWVGEAGKRPEIWAYGLRNPWRFSFAPDGTLWLGDVGQSSLEEIDIITRGGNYGWSLREGTQPYKGAAPPGAIDPVWEYSNGNLARAITGGYVYRGSRMPALHGQYIYSDFIIDKIWALDTGDLTHQTLLENTGRSVSSFGEDENGELYAVDFYGSINRIEQGSGGGGAIPTLLSATGLFTDLASLQVATGLIEYDVNTPLWSDGTIKRRWLSLPGAAKITFSATGAWEMPVGSVVVKNFAIVENQTQPNLVRNLETRVLIHESSGWVGYTYRWNSQQTDATLSTAGGSETLNLTDGSGTHYTRQYDYPSSSDCNMCHTSAAGKLLGLRTRQLNRNFAYSGTGVTDNQLRSFNHIGLFTTDIGAPSQYGSSAALNDTSVSIEQRARDYLDANCSQCHQPNGTTDVTIDLRASVTISAMNAVDAAPAKGNLGVTGANIIKAGDKNKSVLWLRLDTVDPSVRMPPLATHAIDQEAVNVIGQWIDSL